MEGEINKTSAPKRTHVKPAFYAAILESLHDLARTYGYNLVVHGSMNRDMDMILCPWKHELGDVDKLVKVIAKEVGGHVMGVRRDANNSLVFWDYMYHGRKVYVVNIDRSRDEQGNDRQYYFDISVMPVGINE